MLSLMEMFMRFDIRPPARPTFHMKLRSSDPRKFASIKTFEAYLKGRGVEVAWTSARPGRALTIAVTHQMSAKAHQALAPFNTFKDGVRELPAQEKFYGVVIG